MYELWVADGARAWRSVRWELFVFGEVRDVLPSSDPDRVLLCFRGQAEPEDWRAVLRAAGFVVDRPVSRSGST
jgi:hypothetical protein